MLIAAKEITREIILRLFFIFIFLRTKQRVIDETTKQVNEARRRITTYEQTKSKAAKLVDNSQQDMTKLEKMVRISSCSERNLPPSLPFFFFVLSDHFS